VFVREQQGFRAVTVTTAVGSGADTPVLSGLKAGDEVAVQGLMAIKGAWLGLGVQAPAAKDARP
jgi:hydrogenase maturation factor